MLADLGVNPSTPQPGWTAWFLYDVTRLRQADENLQALLRHSTDGIFMIDRDCRIRVFNQACERITGWPADEVLHQEGVCRGVFGCHSADCRHGGDVFGMLIGAQPDGEHAAECLREFCFRHAEAGPLTHERPIRARDGEEKWVEVSYAPVTDEAGEVSCVLGIVRRG